ncbi:DUF4351 domain-containing protein [Longibaculum muris]|uniref:DUF4351 domain-containing protein n=1 Tax=Longibaculum muris TaxID=1796628 RepID=UPI0022DF4365|nr:DUF4351 domain-containing protein [Longibaculum muris]
MINTLTYQEPKQRSKQDKILRGFFKVKAHFADIINAMLFDGKDIIHANELLLCDSDETIYFVYENRINVMERRRDILMHATVNGIPVYIGLEIQSTINYSMPYRLLLYDTMTYHLQYKLIDKDHREHFRPTGVMSTVLYSGDRTWHQPHSLLDRILVPEPLKGLMNTWKGNIRDIKDINVELLRNEKVKSLVSAVQTIYRWNKDTSTIKELVLSKEVAIVVAVMTNSKELVIRIEKEEREEVDMCQVLEEFKLESEMRGLERGLKQGKIQTIVNQLKSKFGFVSKELIMKIEESSDDKIDALTIKIIDARSEEELMKVLS